MCGHLCVYMYYVCSMCAGTHAHAFCFLLQVRRLLREPRSVGVRPDRLGVCSAGISWARASPGRPPRPFGRFVAGALAVHRDRVLSLQLECLVAVCVWRCSLNVLHGGGAGARVQGEGMFAEKLLIIPPSKFPSGDLLSPGVSVYMILLSLYHIPVIHVCILAITIVHACMRACAHTYSGDLLSAGVCI